MPIWGQDCLPIDTPQSNGLPAPPRLRLAVLPVPLWCFAPLLPGLIAPVILKRKQKEKTNGTLRK
jgi:hypothetical protein